MKDKLHQSLTVLMAMLILLSSTGFAFVEHECMMIGKSMKLVSEQKSNSGSNKTVYSCCAKSKALKEAKGSFFKKTSCCKENQKFEKLDVTTSFSQILSKLLNAEATGALWAATSFTFIIAEWNLPSDVQSLHTISFSSLFYGRSMLSFIQSFLI